MNGIQIDRLKFQNYRQYGTCEIRFDTDKNVDTHLIAFIAQNGTGKTTMLKGITWCLYGKEISGLSNTHSRTMSLPLVNITTLHLASDEEKVPVSVSFRFISDNGDVIEFIRETSYIYHKNGNPTQGPTKFISLRTPANGENTITNYNSDADILVKQYFDPSIQEFYFFDGEKLAGLFETNLKDSIYNIAQVNLLENTIKHVNARKRDLNKKLGDKLPDIANIQNDLDANVAYIRVTQNQKTGTEAKLEEIKKTFETYDNALRGYKPVEQLQITREKLLKEEKEIEQRLLELKRQQVAFIQKYLTLLPLYPRICKMSSYILQKEKNGNLPPSIDRNQILDLLNHHAKNCPLCGTHLDAHAMERLKLLLEEYSISSATSNFLSSMIAPLQMATLAVKDYKRQKDELQEDFRTIEVKRSENQKELADINGKIMQYGGESGVSKIEELNKKFLEARSQLLEYQSRIINYTNEIDKITKEVSALNQKLAVAQEKVAGLENIKKQVKVLNALDESFTAVKNAIVNETKIEMQKLTWNIFSNMEWKEKTFKSISIDDKYNVILYHKANYAMNDDASGAEAMALAYAFTLAVHQVSGKNCPLVIDSPLGRVSDIAREKMADTLLEAAKDKQIIMLFTPDEYSDVVQAKYEHHATVKQLKLTTDESIIEGVTPYGRK